MVLELTSQNYEKEVAGSSMPVIVDFWAEWCGPCKMLGPVFAKLSASPEFSGKLKFAKLNVDEGHDISEQNGIRGIPCMIMFVNGKEKGRIVGYLPEESLKKKISELLK